MRITPNSKLVSQYVLNGGHCVPSLKRERAAVAALLEHIGSDGCIPENWQKHAFRNASLATGRYWSSARCRLFAYRKGLIRDLEQFQC